MVSKYPPVSAKSAHLSLPQGNIFLLEQLVSQRKLAF
jgi:hypothetical protein